MDLRFWGPDLFSTPFLDKFQLSDKESAGFGKIVRVKIIRCAVLMFFTLVPPAFRTEPARNKDDLSLLQQDIPSILLYFIRALVGVVSFTRRHQFLIHGPLVVPVAPPSHCGTPPQNLVVNSWDRTDLVNTELTNIPFTLLTNITLNFILLSSYKEKNDK